MQIRLVIGFSLLTSFAFGQNLDIDNIYTFSPNKMTKAEQEKKLPALDGLWNKVKLDTVTNLPLLRNELNAPNHNPFFYYDGALLLLSSSEDDKDKTIAANAIARCDLSDIDRKDYVTTLNKLSNDGINVTKAAVKILNDISFSFILPQHAMSFSKDDCLTYMLLPQKEEFYVDTLTSLFKSVNTNSQKSVLFTLWVTYSCKGDSLINSAINDKTISKEISKYAKELINLPELSNEIKQQIKSMDANQIKELRKESLQSFSDESLEELMISTLSLRKNSSCH